MLALANSCAEKGAVRPVLGKGALPGGLALANSSCLCVVTVCAAEAVNLGDKSQHAKDDGAEGEGVGFLQDLVQPRTHPGEEWGGTPSEAVTAKVPGAA